MYQIVCTEGVRAGQLALSGVSRIDGVIMTSRGWSPSMQWAISQVARGVSGIFGVINDPSS